MGNLDIISIKPILNQIIVYFILYAAIVKYIMHFKNELHSYLQFLNSQNFCLKQFKVFCILIFPLKKGTSLPPSLVVLPRVFFNNATA